MDKIIIITVLTMFGTIGLHQARPTHSDAPMQDRLEVKQAKQLKKTHLTQVSKIIGKANIKRVSVSKSVSGAKAFIYQHESGNRTDAINPSSGACGLGQALPCSKMPCSLSDYACQDNFFTNYMKSRYGTWENAVAFWKSHKWW